MTVLQTPVLGGHQGLTTTRSTLPQKTMKAWHASATQNSNMDYCACNKAMQDRVHSSANDHKNFLHYKLVGMVEIAGHWLVLPYSAVQHATDL